MKTPFHLGVVRLETKERKRGSAARNGVDGWLRAGSTSHLSDYESWFRVPREQVSILKQTSATAIAGIDSYVLAGCDFILSQTVSVAK